MPPPTTRNAAPLEAFDRAGLTELSHVFPLTDLSATTAGADPARTYEALRAQWGPVAPVQMEPGVPAWLVLGYREFGTVARAEKLYSRDTTNWRLHRESLLPEGAAIWAYTPPVEKKPWSSFHHDGETRARLRRPLDDALDALPDEAVKERTDGCAGCSWTAWTATKGPSTWSASTRPRRVRRDGVRCSDSTRTRPSRCARTPRSSCRSTGPGPRTRASGWARP